MTAGVQIYCARVGEINGRELRAWHASEDLERLEALTTEHRRLEFSTGRALLRFALEHYTGRPARSHILRTGLNGKPECEGGPKITLAHSGGYVACAIAPTGRIGVDIEEPLSRRNTAEIARQYFSRRENNWLRGQSVQSFYMLWVLKEAYLKANGAGLAGGLDSLECCVEPPTIEIRMPAAVESLALALYSVGSTMLGVAALDGDSVGLPPKFWTTTGLASAPESLLIASS